MVEPGVSDKGLGTHGGPGLEPIGEDQLFWAGGMEASSGEPPGTGTRG